MVKFYLPKVDFQELSQKVKNEVQQHSSSILPTNIAIYHQSQSDHINAVLNGAEAMTQPRLVLPNKLRHLPILGNAKVQKGLLRFYNFFFKEQRSINLSVIHVIRQSFVLNQKISTQVADQANSIQMLLKNSSQVDSCIQSITQQVSDITQQVSNVTQQVSDIAQQVSNVTAECTSITSLITQLESRLTTVENQVKFLENNYGNRFGYLQADITQQKRVVTLLLEKEYEQYRDNVNSSLNTKNQFEEIKSPLELEMDKFYRIFEDTFRGELSQIYERLSVYLPLLEEVKLLISGDIVIDVGCGRGEWLQLLKDNGYQGVGIDINQEMLEQCKSMGLSVLESDALSYLRSLPDSSAGCITGFHIVEHLSFESLVQMINETYRVLRPGGMIIFETPNPRNVLVGSCTFYLDPTHRNPIPPELLQFMARYSGFNTARIVPVNPSQDPLVQENSDLAVRFNQLFYGFMDYAVIGIKK